MENWKPFNNYEGLYEISDLGRIRSLDSIRQNPITKGMSLFPGKIIKICNGKKYKQVTLTKNNIKKTFTIHRQVAIHFIPNPENKPCVNHKDGDVNNNKVSSLEWATYSENEKHSYRVLGKKPNKPFLGKRAFNAKFSNDIVLIIRSDNRTISEISRHYNVARATIRDIKNKRTYADL